MNHFPLWVAISALFTSFAACGLIILTQRWHGKHSLDHDLVGAQKLHHSPVPRVGGFGLALGYGIGAYALVVAHDVASQVALILLLCTAPVFAAGLVEDITKQVRIRTRLLASFVSAALAAGLLGARLTTLDVPYLDAAMQLPWVSLAFTMFAISGMTNACNIIDGLNGLASGSVVIMLAGLTAIASLHHDFTVMHLCLLGIAATIGFMLLNYPFGNIFLGDGGAYLSGFWTAECGVLLLVRNPDVSTFAVLLACFYPVWETIYSIYRRKFVDRVASGEPDMSHLHQLVYKKISAEELTHQYPYWARHGMSTALIYTMVGCCQFVIIFAKNNNAILITGLMAFSIMYCGLYKIISTRSTEKKSDSTKTRHA